MPQRAFLDPLLHVSAWSKEKVLPSGKNKTLIPRMVMAKPGC
jgi:hypothetical protein